MTHAGMKRRAKYPLAPRKLKGSAWFYEHRRGIEVVQELWLEGRCAGASIVVIPWAKAAAAVANHKRIVKQGKKP